jgi:predicted nucleic acid-binding protein
MTRTFFADTSFLVAFYNAHDDHHREARAFIAGLIELEERAEFFITDYIFDETLTTILNRAGKLLAIGAAKKIYSSPSISIVTISPEVFSKAYELFIRYADQEWSFTDCTSISLLREHFPKRLIPVATFDQHFRAAGFQTVPMI